MTARVDPSNVKLPLSSSSPPVPAITTRLSVRSPIKAVSADNESIFAVPSIYKSFHSLVEPPKSLVPSASGKRSPPTVAPAPTISPPLKVPIPAAVTLPLLNTVTPVPAPTFNFDPSKVKLASSSSSPEEPAITTLLSVKSETIAVSATKASMFAVPSRNRSPHSLVAAPICLVPSTSGIKLLPIEVSVVTPVTFILTAVVVPTKLVCADVRIPVTFIWSTDNSSSEKSSTIKSPVI